MKHLNPSSGIACFTDGSAYHRDRSGGWAWVALDAFEGIHAASGAASDVTINQMELHAPTQALLTLYQELESLNILVYSDSEYVVLGITNKKRIRKRNLDWWGDLEDAIALHEHVEFVHVKGHAGNRYNALADKLAGQARREGNAVRANP